MVEISKIDNPLIRRIKKREECKLLVVGIKEGDITTDATHIKGINGDMIMGTSLVVQFLRIHLLLQGTQV